MNTLNMVPIPDGICLCCQDKPATHTYKFEKPRGFGSAFDMLDFEFCCCDDCNRKRFAKWFGDAYRMLDEYTKDYAYEAELCKFIEALPMNAREKVYNAGDPYGIDAQDWIDIQLGEISPELAEKYGLDDELFDHEYEI